MMFMRFTPPRFAGLLALAVLPLCAFGETAPPTQQARNYRLVRQAVAGMQPLQWVFVVVTPEGYVWVSTHEKLQWSVEQAVPAKATLEWAPGCKRMGGEPLESAQELEALAAFCKKRDVNFVHIPGG